eukprot:8421808-Lingulodinium_polyedra.AAC.1
MQSIACVVLGRCGVRGRQTGRRFRLKSSSCSIRDGGCLRRCMKNVQLPRAVGDHAKVNEAYGITRIARACQWPH